MSRIAGPYMGRLPDKERSASGCVVPFVLIAGSIIGFGMFAVNLVERFV